MALYIIGTLASIFLIWCGRNSKTYKEKNKVKCLILVSSFPLLIISALRYDVGTDYFSYLKDFIKISQDIQVRDEPLFYFLNVIIIRLNMNPQWIFIISAVLFCWFTYAAILRDSPYPELSVFLLVGTTYYFASMNGVRQFIASAILLYALRFIEERKLKSYLLFVLLATGFHYSSLIYLPIYWAKNIKITPIKAIALTIIVMISNKYIANFALKLIGNTYYGRYIGSQFDEGKVSFIRLGIQVAILLLALIAYQKTSKYTTYLVLQLASTWIMGFSGLIVLVRRLIYTFGLPSIILVPMAIRKFKDQKIRILISAMVVVLFSVYAFIVIYINKNHNVIPYNSVFGIDTSNY